jgi:riboflavin kinase/FMN adenylyltransferase
VHLLDFSGDIYGRECTVEFVAHLRPELRFGNVEDLVRQIKLDVQHARHMLDAEE